MALTIEIAGIKSIGKLTFPVPGTGVYVLTGENGSGKTTLLACLVRIGEPNSFQQHFRTSKVSKKLDVFTGARVTYRISTPGASVAYTYSGARWDPTPKKNGAALRSNVGYAEVVYIAADERRVTPRKEDFRPTSINQASSFIRTSANAVLGTSKFNTLCTVNVRKGKGQQAFVLEVAGGKYVSEKNLSLGELAILKLLRTLEKVKAGALVLIDELEIALHPMAQEKLLRVLDGIAAAKQLTIIFSTHSATLIRAVRPTQLLFLERNGATVNCVSNCYPTYALGRMAPSFDLVPDSVLLVEDLNAQSLVLALLKKARNSVFAGGSSPTIVCYPVGGWPEVLRFLGRSHSSYALTTSVAALLDKDCEAQVKPAIPAPGHQPVAQGMPIDIQRICIAHKNQIRFLPSTPEIGLVGDLSTGGASYLSQAAVLFTNNTLHSIPLPAPLATGNTPVIRKTAKTALEAFVREVAKRTARSEEEILRTLFDWYVDTLESGQSGAAASLLGPLVK